MDDTERSDFIRRLGDLTEGQLQQLRLQFRDAWSSIPASGTRTEMVNNLVEWAESLTGPPGQLSDVKKKAITLFGERAFIARPFDPPTPLSATTVEPATLRRDTEVPDQISGKTTLDPDKEESPTSIPTVLLTLGSNPQPTPRDPLYALTLSGGGFRATLFHLGVVLTLLKNRIYTDKTPVVGVSGGAILAAHLALNPPATMFDQDGDFAKERGKLVNWTQQLLALPRCDLRNRILRRWLLPFALLFAGVCCLAGAWHSHGYELGFLGARGWLVELGLAGLLLLLAPVSRWQLGSRTDLLIAQYRGLFGHPLSSFARDKFVGDSGFKVGSWGLCPQTPAVF